MSKSIQIHKDNLGVTALDGTPVVSSRKIAEVFEKRHDNIIQAIKRCECSEEFADLNFKVSEYKDVTGRLLPEYLLTKDGFTFLVMGFTGTKAAAFKESYIKCFNDMQRFIIDRYIAKLEYPELTCVIKLQHDNPKFYHFSNEANMINRIVLGATAKQYRIQRKIPKEESIRDYLHQWQLEAITKLQKMDMGLVVAVKEIQERKKILTAYFEKLYGTLQLPVS